MFGRKKSRRERGGGGGREGKKGGRMIKKKLDGERVKESRMDRKTGLVFSSGRSRKVNG